MRLIVCREVLLALAIVAGVLGAVFAIEALRNGRQGVDIAAQSLLRPFMSHELPILYFAGAIPLVATGLIGLLCLSGRNALLPMVRHLRALPMPVWKLNVYIIGLSTPVWLSVLGVASVLHAAVTGRLPAIHADLLVLLAGMTAVAHSIQLPSRRAFSMSPAAMPLVVGVFVGVLRLLPDPAASFATPMRLVPPPSPRPP